MKTLLLLSIACSCLTGFSQTRSELQQFDARQLRISKQGMYTLGGWAALNIGGGLIARSQTTGSVHYFQEMNVIWNTFNLGLAASSLIGSRKEKPFGFANSLDRQQKIEKAFLVNGALDFTYITAGALLIEHSKNDFKNSDRFKGYGESLLVQGGFLLLFDGVMFYVQHKNGKALKPFINQLQVGVTRNGVGVVWEI